MLDGGRSSCVAPSGRPIDPGWPTDPGWPAPLPCCVLQEDFMKAVRKLGEAKKLEGHLAYSAEFSKSE